MSRIDTWTHEHDSLLVETVLKYIREGGTQLNAFEEAGDKLGRTSSGCGFRWNAILRHQYKQAFAEAKKQRLEFKRKKKTSVSGIIVSGEKEVSITPKGISEIKVKEYQGQRVVTFKDIDEVHGRPEGTAKRNFTQNKNHLIEGEDFYQITKGEFRTEFGFGNNAPNGTLLTESGYLMLVKSFTDDIAWEVQRKLVKSYFRIKEVVGQQIHSYMIVDPIERAKAWIKEQEEKKQLVFEKLMLEQQVADYEPKISYYDTILQSTDTLIVSQIAEDYGLTAQALNKILFKEKVQYKLNGQWLPYAEHKGLGYTQSKTIKFEKSSGETGTSLQTRWTQKGRLFIHELLIKRGITPLMDREEKEA